MTRHRWGDPDRREHETVRVCVKCGIAKVTHHEFDGPMPIHWSDYFDADRPIRTVRVPVCVPVEQGVTA